MNSLRIAQDFLRGLSLLLGCRVDLPRAERLAMPAGAPFVGAMTPVIFITIGFLSCWFLLYVLMEWTQDPLRKAGVRRAGDTEISQRQRRSQQVVNFRSKERP